MRRALLGLVLVFAVAAAPTVGAQAATTASSLEKSILDRNGMIAGSVWMQMPPLAKYAYLAGFFGAVFSVSDWIERIASERSSQEIDQVAVMTLGLTKGPDITVKWVSEQLDAFYARGSNGNVQLSDAVLAILRRDAQK